MKTHELKCWPKFFEPIVEGRKKFDVRNNDRGFEVGDILHFREWNPDTEKYSGLDFKVEVTYMADNPDWLRPGYVVMSINSVEWRRILGAIVSMRRREKYGSRILR